MAALERPVMNYLGLTSFTGSQPSPSASTVVKNIFVRSVWRSSKASVTHFGQQKKITDKAYNEAKMMTKQKQRVKTFEDP